jgi:plastocyanin
MDFWRSGRARSHRDSSVTASGQRRSIMYRLRHLYFPPWVPVAFIIVVVFGILGLLFVTRSATGAPRIGEDHWHATYTFYACGEKQPNAPTWESGVHTHGDGIMHIHPFQRSEEGAGARMVKWFEYGHGQLTQSKIRLPGLSKTWENGEKCPDGTKDAGQEGTLQVFVNGAKLDDWSRFIPHDGDRIQLIFGPEQEIVQLDDRQVIDESNATRTIEMTVTDTDGNETTTTFSPAAPSVKAGETVKVLIHNTGKISHQLRIYGPDGKISTADDFVAVPVGSDPKTVSGGDVIQPGADGFVVIRFDNAGQIAFSDPSTAPAVEGATPEPIAKGTIIVEGAASGSPTPAPEEQVDVTLSATMVDSQFQPAELSVAAGKKFNVELKNDGQFVHNMRIDGPDHKFDTDDDITSPDIGPGETKKTPGATLEAGTYSFRDDFNPRTMTGTLTVQ